MTSTIRVAELKELLKLRLLQQSSSSRVRLLDAAYTAAPTGTHDEFMKDKYGKVEELAALWKNADYEKEHIPGAVHFHTEIATFPGKFQKASLYPADIFQRYARLLGVNQNDDIIVYGRGMVGGMLFAARAWWLLKTYGARSVRVLEGGLEKWKAEGGEVKSGEEKNAAGDFVATEPSKDLLITYEELFDGSHEPGKAVNVLDARPPAQFNGTEPLPFPAPGATGAHIHGALNVPLPSLLSAGGELKEPEEIRQVFSKTGASPCLPSAALCNGGVQASMLALALEKGGYKWKVFNGSMIEIARRSPEKIDEK